MIKQGDKNPFCFCPTLLPQVKHVLLTTKQSSGSPKRHTTNKIDPAKCQSRICTAFEKHVIYGTYTHKSNATETLNNLENGSN